MFEMPSTNIILVTLYFKSSQAYLRKLRTKFQRGCSCSIFFSVKHICFWFGFFVELIYCNRARLYHLLKDIHKLYTPPPQLDIHCRMITMYIYMQLAWGGVGWGVKIQNTYSTVLINFIFTPKGACLKRKCILDNPF